MPTAGPALATASAPSSRIDLARAALKAALAVPAVVRGDAGDHGLRVTADPAGGTLRGVSVIAERDGGYTVDLRLVAHVTPLVPLADAVRKRVFASAKRGHFEGQVTTVNVEFARLIEEDEEVGR